MSFQNYEGFPPQQGDDAQAAAPGAPGPAAGPMSGVDAPPQFVAPGQPPVMSPQAGPSPGSDSKTTLW